MCRATIEAYCLFFLSGNAPAPLARFLLPGLISKNFRSQGKNYMAAAQDASALSAQGKKFWIALMRDHQYHRRWRAGKPYVPNRKFLLLSLVGESGKRSSDLAISLKI